MAIATQLVDRVMDLPAVQRAELARRLILSLEPADFDEDAEASWEAEIEKRLAAVDRGEAKLLDWRESVGRVRKSLKRRKRQ